jgi:peptide/nickel transport system substrate-binding protein
MRQLFSLVLVGTFATALGACTSSDASTRPAAPSGEFRILIPARPSSLNPNTQLDESAFLVGRSIFSHLVSINEAGRLLPELAESWSTSDDGLAYTFRLRPNIRWHDGVPFTAADVRWSIEMIARDGHAKDALAALASVEAPDPVTVVMRLTHPWAPFVSQLAQLGMSILPRHIYEGHDWRTHPANDRPVGTGPFKFGRWQTPDTLVLEANTSYFRTGPFVERILFSVVPVDAAGDRLLNGEADYTVIRPPTLDYRAPPVPPVAYRTLPTSARYYLSMNLRRSPLSDRRVRHAIAAAIDRDAIVKGPLHGLGVPATGWYTPDVEWAYNPNTRVPEHNERTARQLLDEAGASAGPSGRRFNLTMVVVDAPPAREIAAAIGNQLDRVGIRVDVERLPAADWPNRVIVAHDYDLTVLSGLQGPDPDALRRRFAPDSATGAYLGYASKSFREAVERGARSTELSDRAAAYYRAQEILAQDVPFVPLTEVVKVVVYHERVSGLPQLEARGLVGVFDFSLVRVGARRAEAAR